MYHVQTEYREGIWLPVSGVGPFEKKEEAEAAMKQVLEDRQKYANATAGPLPKLRIQWIP